MKLSYGKLFCLAVHTALMVAAVWFLAIAIFGDVAMDARLGRLAVVLACIANLFPQRKRIIRGVLFIAAVALVVIATFVFIYKYGIS